MARLRRRSPEFAALERRPPLEFTMELLRVGVDELGVFSWSTDTPQATAALTAAEQQVLRLGTRGASNEKIASARGTSVRTVANQVAALLRKLGAGHDSI